MKILGHAYIATRAVKGNRSLLIIGALLPEMLPYIPNDVFDYKKFHEGGKKLLNYLNQHQPKKRDLALGMLTHGIDYGADGYAKELKLLVKDKQREVVARIIEADDVKESIAQIRVHNYIGLGIDWLLVQNEPEFVKEVQKTIEQVRIKEVSQLLAKAFKKKELKIREMVRKLFKEIYLPEDLTSLEGLARTWVRQASGLPEKDKIDVTKAKAIIQMIAELIRFEWRNYLDSTSIKVKKNLEPLFTIL